MLSALLGAAVLDRPGVRPYLDLIRAPFLLFTLIVVSLPVSVAIEAGVFDPTNTALAFGSVLFGHIAVNTLNIASDYRTGIDAETDQTAYSGGNDVITDDRLSYSHALVVGSSAIVVSAALAVPLILEFGRLVLLFYLAGIVLVVGYTDVFARTGLGEFACGLGLTFLPTVAVGYIQAGRVLDPVVALSVPMFLLGFNLLLINEFPDVPVDARNGRVNIPIVVGRRRAGYLYVTIVGVLILSLVIPVLRGELPVTVLIALLPVGLLVPVFEALIIDRDSSVGETELERHTLWVQTTIAALSGGMLLAAVL